MNLTPDPRALPAVLRSKLYELSGKGLLPGTYLPRWREKELLSQITGIEDYLDKLCGDHDVKTPEAWRHQN